MDILSFSQLILNITATIALIMVGLAVGVTIYLVTKTATAVKRSAEKVSHNVEEIKNRWAKMAVIVPIASLAMRWLKKKRAESKKE